MTKQVLILELSLVSLSCPFVSLQTSCLDGGLVEIVMLSLLDIAHKSSLAEGKGDGFIRLVPSLLVNKTRKGSFINAKTHNIPIPCT